MQHPPVPIELPQFTGIATVAFRLAQAFAAWHDPHSGEDAFTYFTRTPRSTGDEHNLLATLIRERILPVFNSTSDQIEYESAERYDLTLWSQHSQHLQQRHRIAIIEAKSSSVHIMAEIEAIIAGIYREPPDAGITAEVNAHAKHEANKDLF
jgi:hypothetical protein